MNAHTQGIENLSPVMGGNSAGSRRTFHQPLSVDVLKGVGA